MDSDAMIGRVGCHATSKMPSGGPSRIFSRVPSTRFQMWMLCSVRLAEPPMTYSLSLLKAAARHCSRFTAFWNSRACLTSPRGRAAEGGAPAAGGGGGASAGRHSNARTTRSPEFTRRYVPLRLHASPLMADPPATLTVSSGASVALSTTVMVPLLLPTYISSPLQLKVATARTLAPALRELRVPFSFSFSFSAAPASFSFSFSTASLLPVVVVKGRGTTGFASPSPKRTKCGG
mmetsp:Transcript_2313/g.4674  ORF Transcript_2313/g.4674 Transcript_2313/m.4674 type:complete len:234 (-) Transcript_2313:724-1425(-)